MLENEQTTIKFRSIPLNLDEQVSQEPVKIKILKRENEGTGEEGVEHESRLRKLEKFRLRRIDVIPLLLCNELPLIL